MVGHLAILHENGQGPAVIFNSALINSNQQVDCSYKGPQIQFLNLAVVPPPPSPRTISYLGSKALDQVWTEGGRYHFRLSPKILVIGSKERSQRELSPSMQIGLTWVITNQGC